MFKYYCRVSGVAIALSATMPVLAIEAQPTGQFQIQAAYVSEAVEAQHWLLQMPNAHIGVTAVESMPNGTFTAHWRAGFEPFSDELELDQQQVFVNWQQGVFSLWGGQLRSLEATFLEADPMSVLSVERGGLAVAKHILETENKAIRADFQSGEALVFSGQLVMDENQDDATWSLAAVVQSPEGSFATTYRKTDADENQWGTKVRWVSGTAALVAATVFQDEILAWDLGVQFQGARSVTFVNYAVDGEDDGLWRVGIHQMLTASLVNFSEIVWDANNDLQWSTGFQLSF
ncbi:hypothetical protein [Reinekea sp.]|uniref:hypothetical protein n=1 Tax=Reinekea sp. TaxID=1970455 RepID=UPI00398A3A79